MSQFAGPLRDLQDVSDADASAASAKSLYLALHAGHTQSGNLSAQNYLHACLEQARVLPHDLPESLDDANVVEQWMLQRAASAGDAYQTYLSARKEGAPRRYFRNRAHALYFLQAVAPTKLVDGAWLYGLLPHWRDVALHGLIRTYLEELGDGVAEQNHVALYRRLLAAHGCGQWQHLDDTHFVQGAIQLSLASEAAHFLPELIGYNLGYEQLPLHLMITSYELNELGIDPYYFTLHVTIDNAAAGHARKAVQSLQQAAPVEGDRTDFYRRVADGYRLNDLGASTLSVIASFDLHHELVRVLQDKAAAGRNMHSDYCRLAGRTVNEWLAQRERIPAFLQQMEKSGWIRRGEAPENSRFWRLIEGEHAEMFGVFNEYERQLLRDWIAAPAGDHSTDAPPRRANLHLVPHRAQRQAAARTQAARAVPHRVTPLGAPRGILRRHHEDQVDDFSRDLRALESRLAALDGEDAMMRMLIPLMSPARHHTPIGLMATRIFSRLFA
jgi:hypothetical protein